MKRIFAIILSALLLLSLAACNVDYKAQIVGTWVCNKLDSDETKAGLLEYIELYDEEIALVTANLYTTKQVTFNEDGTYFFTEDPDGVKEHVRDFYDQVFTQLYNGRASLVDTSAEYGTDLSQLTEEAFFQFYAELYSYTSYEELLDGLSEKVYDYDSFGKSEEGSFTVGSKKIDFDAITDEDDGVAEYKVEDNKLVITYSNGAETYTKK